MLPPPSQSSGPSPRVVPTTSPAQHRPERSQAHLVSFISLHGTGMQAEACRHTLQHVEGRLELTARLMGLLVQQ